MLICVSYTLSPIYFSYQLYTILARNKEKLRQELAQKKRENRNVDPVCLAKHEEEKLERVASMVATLEVMETEISRMVQQLEELEEEDQVSKQQPPRHTEQDAAEGLRAEKEDEPPNVTSEEESIPGTSSGAGADTVASTLEKDSMLSSQSGVAESNYGAGAHTDTNKPTSDDPTTADQLVISLDEIQKKEQREQQKIALVEAILSCLHQTQPLRDNISQLTKSLYIFRADTSADKIVCEVSGNFMSVSVLNFM
jgi:hypothetical protein